MANPITELLNADQLKKNELTKERLIKLINDGDVFLMAGAGVSAMAGLPGWLKLIDLLQAEVLEIDADFAVRGEEESLIGYTSRLVAVLGARFDDIISDTFGGPGDPTDAQIALVKLPFRCVLTTNYDRTLLSAVSKAYDTFFGPVVFAPNANRRETAKCLRAINDSSVHSPRVIHLHGYCDNTDSIILSGVQYEEKYGIKLQKGPAAGDPAQYQDNAWPFLRRIMWALMATRRLVYFGFSLDDEYFRVMHEIVSDDARQGGTDMHFLIQRVTAKDSVDAMLEKAKFFSKSYGIETIFFGDDESYTGLPTLIVEFQKGIEQRNEQKVQEGQSVAVAVAHPAAKINEAKTNVASFLDLVEQINNEQ